MKAGKKNGRKKGGQHISIKNRENSGGKEKKSILKTYELGGFHNPDDIAASAQERGGKTYN